MKKFFEFKNVTSTEADLYIYGEIVQEKYVDWWTGEESKTDVALMDFKEELDNIGNVQTLNLYINSPGGDVFVASAMISMLERVKNKGTAINAYVDGISASAASFLMFVADNIYLYKNSIVMIHKPMSYAYGNSIDMQKVIDTLEKIESSTMIPMYMSKAKISEDEVKNLIEVESWLSSEEMDNYFDVTVLNEEKTAVACSSNLFDKYKNVPKNVRDFFVPKNNTSTVTYAKNIEENDDETLKNEEKGKNIKSKLMMIKGSLISKQMKGKGEINETKSNS